MLMEHICNVLDQGVGYWVQGVHKWMNKQEEREEKDRKKHNEEGRKENKERKERSEGGKENDNSTKTKDGSVLKSMIYDKSNSEINMCIYIYMLSLIHISEPTRH